MPGEKFTLMQYSVNAILGLIEANDFVIPEIQRPFVWKRSQVRDLIDSLYHGYPTGYIITWKNPSVRTKDGGYSQGKKVLIDGQQRITALMAAISGKEVLDEDFKKDRIKIAFNPLAADDSKRFAVQDASHLKDKKWIPDISVLFSANFKPRAFENEYAKNNPNVDLDELAEEISKLTGIANRQIGVIELDHSLDIDEVTEIFIRINSKGTALSQSDFVMSKMAADTDHGGSIMRKAVDYFCHLAVKPEFYAIRPDEKMYDISVLGTVESFGSIISSRSNYIVIDHYNLASLRDKSNPMPTEEFRNNRIIRFRSHHHSTCTMSALTDELLYGFILMLKKLGKPVYKTFNHRRIDHSVSLSQDKFYVQFSVDDGCDYSHIHLPYQYWGRLDIPVIDCLDENADIHQPNSAVLLSKISEFIENYFNIV